jgi:hypothetical protein
MDFKVTNKLASKKNARRTIMPHVYWGMVALVILLPTGFLFGLNAGGTTETMNAMAGIMSERAGAPPPLRDPSAMVKQYLMPIGPAQLEWTELSGAEVWSSAYPAGNEGAEVLLHDIRAEWDAMGLETEVTDQGLVAVTNDGLAYLMASEQEPGVVRLFCWPRGGNSAESSANPEVRFHESGLPDIPVGSELVDLSQSGGGFVFYAYVRGGEESVLASYRGALLQDGWEVLDLGAATPGTTAQGDVSMFKKGSRQVMVGGSRFDDHTTLLSLVVF